MPTPSKEDGMDATEGQGRKAIRFADPAMQKGWTPLWNGLLLRRGLSANAKTLYALLSHYAWSGEEPSQDELAEILGVSEPTLRKTIAELKTAAALEVRRRGLGMPNEYILLLSKFGSRSEESSGQDGKQLPIPLSSEDGRSKTAGEAKASPARERAKKPPDLLWDVFDEQLGKVETKSERGRRNSAVKELREIGATPEELRRRIRRYRREWPDITISEKAITGNWTTLAGPAQKPRTAQAEAWVRAVGWQYPDGALAEELAKRVDDDGDRRRLKELATSLQKEE